MEYTIRDLLSAVFRHARGLVIFWVVTIIAVLVFFSQSRKLYDSKAKILVSLGAEVQGKAEFLSDKNLQLLQREQQIHDEQQILESHEVLLTTAKWILGDPTLKSPSPPRSEEMETARRYFTGEEPEPTLLLRGVHAASSLITKFSSKRRTHDEQLEDLVRELSNDLSVNLIFDSDALDVTFRYRDPAVAQTILRLIIASYLDHHIQVFQSAADEDLLRSQYQHSVQEYGDRLAELSAYMRDHGIYNDDSQMNSLLEAHEALTQSLNQARSDESYEEARLASLTSIAESLQRFSRYSSTEVRNKERDDLSAKLDNATLEQNAMLARHPEASRAYKEETAKIAEIHKLLDGEPETVTDQTEQRRTPSADLVDSDIVAATVAKRGDRARIGQVSVDLNKNAADAKVYAENLQTFDALKLNVALAKDKSELMAKAYVDSHLKTLTSQNAITDVSLIDAPTWDQRPASPKKQMVAAAAIVLLLIGSVAVMIILIATDQTLPDPRAATMSLGTQVIGTFPSVSGAGGDDLLRHFGTDCQAEFARMYLALPRRPEEGRAILLTESNSGEGATLLGLGLAQFLSGRAHEKTTFYDATAHSLSDEWVKRANSDLLTVFHGGISGQELSSLLEQLRGQNRNLVIAVGEASDATNLMALRELSPTTFLLVEAAKTRRAVARFSLETLQKFGFEDVKVVLNKRKLYIPDWMMRFV